MSAQNSSSENNSAVGCYASCFKAYDIRGVVPNPINAAFAFALGQAVASVLHPQTAVIGHDARLSGPELRQALAGGLESQGVAVTTIGLCGTEEIYYASFMHNFEVGIMVTGSHNPANENGFKIVRAGAIPVDATSGLTDIAGAMPSFYQKVPVWQVPTSMVSSSYRQEYVAWLLDYAGISSLPQTAKLKIVVDAGNGCAGLLCEALRPHLPFELVPLNFEPDGTFPNGVPNPLLPERRAATAKAVRSHRADLGVAFDGDFDRCFFFTANGEMVESCYLIGPMAKELLRRHQGATIVHDTRVYWLTQKLVTEMGGTAHMSRGGHSYMKRTMREQNALFGGEMSAHFFYRDFAFCDSGMLTFLLVTALLARSGSSLGDLVRQGMTAFPCSGEINFCVRDVQKSIARVRAKYEPLAQVCNNLDGIDLQFPDWRFSLRGSNTEPLLRLNVETVGSCTLLAQKTAELKNFILQEIAPK